MILRLVIFLALNFGALAIGGFSTNTAVMGEWYQGLNKAPWTPPGWVFGAAWTTIMVCFSLYLAVIYPKIVDLKSFMILYAIQWVLNVGWNFAFFNQHWVLVGVLILVALIVLVASFFQKGLLINKPISLLILPYLIWLCIATSLNVYILMNN